MATGSVKINTDLLRWAYKRAGITEEKAVSVFPLLSSWLLQEKFPTVAQLQKFAAKFFVPFGYLFLPKPPEETLPFPMFRGAARLTDRFNLNVYDTVMTIKKRQEWLEEYLVENEIDLCPIVGVVSQKTPVKDTVALLGKTLSLTEGWTLGMANVDEAIRTLTRRLEECGIFLAYNGVVGNNTHRTIEVEECRGFALVSETAPYIFVNSADSKTAQLFTLVHEAAHLMLGVSAGHAGGEDETHDVVENYCDAVAAEFLVPEQLFTQMWNDNIGKLSKNYKVSEAVIARRAYNLHLIDASQYRAFWSEYSGRVVASKRKGGGGDFYLTSVKRVGRLFAIHVRNAVAAKQLDFNSAYRLTGLYGKSYQRFMTNSI